MTEDTIAFMYVLAQIAGIFIGFGALISASKSSTATKSETEILASVVYIGIMVVVGSLLPLLLDRYGLNSEWSLRAGAVVVLAMAWALIIAHWSINIEHFKNTPALSTFFWIQESFIQIPLVLILIGVLSQFSEAFYLTALVVSAFEAAQLLVGLVFAKPISANEHTHDSQHTD